MCRVFDDREAVRPREVREIVELARKAGVVHRHHRSRPWRDETLDVVDVDRDRVLADVAEDRPRPDR